MVASCGEGWGERYILIVLERPIFHNVLKSFILV